MAKSEIKNVVFRSVKTYTWLLKIAKDSYDTSVINSKRSFYNRLISMLFCALTLEGFFNHLGNFLDEEWNLKEKGRSRKEIFEEIFSLLEYDVDKRKKPFCYLDTIFEFRDQIVHAKTENLRIENARMDEQNDIPILPGTRWERMIRDVTAKNFLENTKEIVRILHEKGELPGIPFGPLWDASWIVDRKKLDKNG